MKFYHFFISFVLFASYTSAQQFTFREALVKSKENNLLLKSELKNIELAHFDVVTASLRPNPNLNNQTLQQLDSKYFPNNSVWSSNLNRQVWYQLTKPFQLDNLRKKKINFAEMAYRVTEKSYFETERNVLNAVANQWLDAWHSFVRFDAIAKTLNNIDSLNEINENRFKNQVITQSDLIRTKLLAEQYRLRYSESKLDYFNQLRQLKMQLSLTDSVSIAINDPFLLPSLPDNLDSLYALSLQQRADLQAVQASRLLAQSNIILQKSKAIPQPELGLIWNPQNAVPYLGFFGTIQLPIWSRNQGEIGKSKVFLQQVEVNYQRTEMQLRTEVEAAYKTFKTYQANFLRYESLLRESDTVLETVRYAYLRGATSLIDFLEAQRAWFETKQNYFETLYNYRKSYLNMLFVTGTLNKI
jgi:cobalt-zinc-cadmium efflux system outer membrane protein